MPIFSVRGSIANPGTVESHFSDLVFNSRFTGLVTVTELKYPVTVTAAESIMSFWVLPVTVNLNGLATGAMKVNCDHETTLKASIISLIQLIGGITVYRSDSLRKGRATTKQQTDYGGELFFSSSITTKTAATLWRLW
ncbi:Uncharacterised protein [Escherichia coli]|nr:Uncharacterised protein [Escherichia coli]